MVKFSPKSGIFIGFLALLLLIVSCKKKTTEVKTSVEKSAINAVFLPYSFAYKTLSFRAKIDYNDGKMDLSFNGNFRIQQDSLIWISFTGPFNIEAARVMITRDSVKIWNKLQGQKESHPISYLQRYFPVANYFTLQDFLFGNPLLLSKATIVVDSAAETVSFAQDDMKLHLEQLANTKNYTVFSYMLKDKMLNQALNAIFDNPKPIDNHFFSCERNINLQRGAQNIKIDLDIYKYQSGEVLAFPF